MPTWLMILTTALGTLMTAARSTIFFYGKYKHTPNNSKTSSIFWHKENPTETEAMMSGCPQQSTGSPKIKAIPQKVRKHYRC